MPLYQRCGLYFTPAHIETARKHRHEEPFRTAYDRLALLPADASLEGMIADGFRWRFDDDSAAGERLTAHLMLRSGLDLAQYNTYFEALAAGTALAQAFELGHSFPAFPGTAQAEWQAAYRAFIDLLNVVPEGAHHLDVLWLGLLNTVSGLTLQDDARFETGTAIFRQAIESDIRPEGYLPRLVEGRDGGSLQRDLLAAGALALMAEAATAAGVDLWGYHFRGVSALTVVSYLVYYYYYPEQWRWDSLDAEASRALYAEWGGFVEMAARRGEIRDVRLLLDEQRPFFNPALGGLTTLSHAPAPRKRLFGR